MRHKGTYDRYNLQSYTTQDDLTWALNKISIARKLRPLCWAQKWSRDRKSVGSTIELLGVLGSQWNILFERIQFSLALAYSWLIENMKTCGG